MFRVYDCQTDKMGHKVSQATHIQLAGRMISTSVKDVDAIMLSLNLPTYDLLEALTCELSRIPASNKLGPDDFVR
jgi:hypothetical protein